MPNGNSILALTPRLIAVFDAASEVAGSDELSEAHLLQGMLLEGESLPVRYLASLGHAPELLLARLTPTNKSTVADATRMAGGCRQNCFDANTVAATGWDRDPDHGYERCPRAVNPAYD